MYKVMFKYKNGKKGICTENGKELIFETEKEAEEYANKLNNKVVPNIDDFFPVWSAVKC